MKQIENLEFINDIDSINMNVVKKNLFLANLTSLDPHKKINESTIDIMNLLCDLYLKEDNPSTYLSYGVNYTYNYNSSSFHVDEYNPFALLMHLNYEPNRTFDLNDPTYGINSNFYVLLKKLIEKNFSIINSSKSSSYNKDPLYEKDINEKIIFIESHDSLPDSLLKLNKNFVIFSLFLNILKDEIGEIKFKEFIYNNNIFSKFIEDKKIYDFSQFMKNYDLDINIPNNEGIYPIMLIKDLESLMTLHSHHPEIDFSVTSLEGATIQHFFTNYPDSIKMLDYIKKISTNTSIENLKEQNLNELLILVEKKFTKANLQQFIKKNQLSDDDLGSIKDFENSNLALMILNQENVSKFELFKNIPSLTEINKNNEGVLEHLLITNFNDHKDKYQKTVFKYCLPYYENYHSLSFNILQQHNNGDKTANHFNKYTRPSLNADLPILNNIFEEKFSTKLLNQFLKYTIQDTNIRQEFFNYFNGPISSRTGTQDFDFLIQHFIENQSIINKTFTDFSLTNFVCDFENSPKFNNLNSNKLFIFNLFLNKIPEFYDDNKLNFKEFINNCISLFISDLDALIAQKSILFREKNKEYNESEITEYFKVAINDEVFNEIKQILPQIFKAEHLLLPKLIEILKEYNSDEDLAKFISYVELQNITNKTISSEQSRKKQKI